MPGLLRHACARLMAALLLGAFLVLGSLVLEGSPNAQEGAGEPTPIVAETTSRHTLVVEGQTLAYTVKIGTIGLPEEGATTVARLVYTSYSMDGGDPGERPVSFVVNGGPGAASAYLHLGALGPARLVFGPDGQTPSPPSRIEPNPRTWLAFTDLVFIDPVGTGFSRVSPSAVEEGRSSERDYWSVDTDLRSIGGFVRQYLTRNERWRSPKVLVGESYGGFRMAALANRLPEEFGVALNGVVLVSPALEFQLQAAAEWDVLPWVLRVPTMAAVAQAHGRGTLPAAAQNRDGLGEVEAFALGPLLSALAAPSGQPPGESAAFERLAGYLGLAPDLVRRERGRISSFRFADELLDDRDRRLSVYDGRFDRPKRRTRGDDVYLAQITAALAGGLADYIRNDLGVGTNLPYLVLNQEVFRRWSWESDGRPGRQAVGAAAELVAALTSTPALRVLLVHGLHDLVTPYFTSAYLMDQLLTDADARRRLVLKLYPGGHMFYARDASLVLFHKDATVFFADITERQAGG